MHMLTAEIPRLKTDKKEKEDCEIDNAHRIQPLSYSVDFSRPADYHRFYHTSLFLLNNINGWDNTNYPVT